MEILEENGIEMVPLKVTFEDGESFQIGRRLVLGSSGEDVSEQGVAENRGSRP